jgi:hypothetical protein
MMSMLRRRLACITIVVFLLILFPLRTFSQSSSPKSAQDEALDLLVTQYSAQTTNDGKLAVITSPGNFAPYFLVTTNPAQATINQKLFQDFEDQRIDKQVTTSSSSAGSTSVANTGSVPWLFGFAVEHGALTQSVENNQIVFRGNVANVISALHSQNYISSYVTLQEQNALIRNIAKTSFSISFNAAQNTNGSIVSSPGASSTSSKQNTLAGFSIHYDIYNHRDPRDSKWERTWADVRLKMGTLPNATATFRKAIKTESADWEKHTREEFQLLGASPTDAQVRAFLKHIADDLVARFGSSAEVKAAAQDVAAALISSRQIEGEAFTAIMHSPTLSFEYSYVRQTTGQVPTTIQGGTPSLTSSIPNLSNFNLIFNTYLVAGSQLTLNGSADIFDSIPIGSRAGQLRDCRISAQLDIPLKEITNVGKPTLTFSGLFLDLFQQPLGQQVKVNGVAVDRTGSIGLFQAKISIPVKGSGLKIPISFTASNRTELIKENDVRGAIGVTFDLDSLFSKAK